MIINGFFDGACEPINPDGIGTCGWHFEFQDVDRMKLIEDGDIITEDNIIDGKCEGMTNNVAEYCGLIGLLKSFIEECGKESIQKNQFVVHGDSQLVIYQMAGYYRVKQGAYIPYYKLASELAKKFKNIRFMWISRDENTIADKITKRLYEIACWNNGITPRYNDWHKKEALKKLEAASKHLSEEEILRYLNWKKTVK